ncbi:MAG: UvrB/UvrC motif-containing protein [Oscillospiraceae bacterium]|nr:UvrB/UvrC motif-containing protein [Oscillospiraceae bacterium]
MKCEKCGKEANVYYRSNVNGKVTTMNLCEECAEKVKNEGGFMDMDRMFDNMFGNMFSDVFGGSLFTPITMNPWNGFGMMPMFRMPKFRIMLEPMTGDEHGAETKAEKKAEVKDDQQIDPEMAKRRELNMLRSQMEEAVKNEEFEKAAELRDKIRSLNA